MFEIYLKKLKKFFNKDTKKNNKKTIENLVVFLVLLIITVIAIKTIWGEKNDNYEDENTNLNNNEMYKQLVDNSENLSNNTEINEYNLENNLEDILSKIAGVGSVDVLVTYSESSEVIAMYNEKNLSSETDEEDTNGGKRKVDQLDSNKEIIFEDKNGKKTPITQKVIMPKIEGAVVIAEGAKDINVKTNIIQAVTAATGLSSYRIQVFEMK